MRYLVTGGTGFIGSALVRALAAQGHEVLLTGRDGEQNVPGRCIGYAFHDLKWADLGPIDAVFHQAAISNTTHQPASDFYFVNLQYAKSLFLEAARHGVSRIIYASSCAVYGNLPSPFREDGPTDAINAYAGSKILLDEWTMEWAPSAAVNAVGLRYSNVYGPGEAHKGKSACMIYQLAQQMKDGHRPKLFKWGEQSRDFVYVEDVIRANLLALNVAGATVCNVGSGVATSFNEVVKTLAEEVGGPGEPEYIDNPYAGQYQDWTVCDLSKSDKVLGYRPQVSLRDGIRKYFKS